MRRHRGQQVLAVPERPKRHDADRAADRARLRPSAAAGAPGCQKPGCPGGLLDRGPPPRDTPAVTPTDENAREVEESRESYREWLSGPESFLAAVARHELPVGQSLRFGVKGDIDLPDAGSVVTVAATEDGFRVDGFKRGPGMVRLGRYRLRLSHQNAPAGGVIDPPAQPQRLAARWVSFAASLR